MDLTHLTPDEKINGIGSLKVPNYLRNKVHGQDVRETMAQLAEMIIQLGVNLSLDPDEALEWARKLQESVSQSEFDSWVATLLDGGPSLFFETKAALIAKHPNGAPGVALVRETDPAKIYVWNGSAWEDFGDYQGIEIKNKSVTTPKLAPNAVTWDKTDGVIMSVGNLYTRSKTYIADKYSDTSGKLENANGWGVDIVDIPLVQRNYSVWIPGGLYHGEIGSISYLDDNLNTLGVAYNAPTVGTYNGIPYINITLPTNASKIGITTLRPNRFDYRGQVIVVPGNVITEGSLKSSIRQIFGADFVDTYSRNEIANLKGSKIYGGKKWVAFGDSLTEVNSRTTKNYHSYVADDLGFTVNNMGVGGTGYKRTSENNTAFYQRISNVPLDADVITIFGSLNDLGAGVPIGTANDTGTDTLGGAINTTLDNLNSRLPVVPVGIISPTPWQYSKPWDESNTATQYTKLLADICHDRGIPFLDLYHSSGLRPWDTNYRTLMYSRDDGNGTHPDEKGHKLFYPKVREFIKTLI